MIKKCLKRNVNNHRSLLLAPQVLQATHFQCGFQKTHLHRSQVLRRKTQPLVCGFVFLIQQHFILVIKDARGNILKPTIFEKLSKQKSGRENPFMRSCTAGEAVFVSSRNAMLDETKQAAWETSQVLECIFVGCMLTSRLPNYQQLNQLQQQRPPFCVIGKRSVQWRRRSQPCLHQLHVFGTAFSWRPQTFVQPVDHVFNPLPYFSLFSRLICQFDGCLVSFGLGAHGWVARIFQPSHLKLFREYWIDIPTVDIPDYPRHPASTKRFDTNGLL